jgi:GNAT superfamily N-acetyltransferase
MIDSVIIEPITLEYQAAINKLFDISIRDAFQQDGFVYTESELLQEIDLKKQIVAQAIQSEHSDSNIHVLIAKIEDKIVGTISYGPSNPLIHKFTDGALAGIGEIGGLYVLPDYQNKGIGSALIQAMIHFLHTKEIKSFCLDSGYKRAQQRWLRKFGEPYKVVEKVWGPDSIFMIWLCEVQKMND